MPLPRYNPLDHVPVTGIVAVTQTVVGCGIGLLLANKLGKRAQTATAVTLFSVGLVATLPVIINFFARQINRPIGARHEAPARDDPAGLRVFRQRGHLLARMRWRWAAEGVSLTGSGCAFAQTRSRPAFRAVDANAAVQRHGRCLSN